MNSAEEETTRMSPDRICLHCQTPLQGDALGGLCPACLLKQGAGEDSLPGSSFLMFEPPTVEELAPHFPALEIVSLLGKGGMGAVYKARQKQLDRVVALKILPPEVGNTPGFQDRFMREARALAKLSHANIVTLYEFGHTEQGESPLYYFLMEYVDGVNLRQLLQAGRVSPREALAIVPQVCDALQYAHDQGIVHRDIKPENLLLDRLGRVKVADFGLAKLVDLPPDVLSGNTAFEDGSGWLSQAGQVMGTPQYMAPEQLDSPSDVDHRADIYALGVVFYQMLTGELPDRQMRTPSPVARIDVRLDEVVLKALSVNPERRYANATAFKTGMQAAQKEEPSAASQGVFSNQWLPLGEHQRGLFIVHWSRVLKFILVTAGGGLLLSTMMAVFVGREAMSPMQSLFSVLICPLGAVAALLIRARYAVPKSEHKPVDVAPRAGVWVWCWPAVAALTLALWNPSGTQAWLFLAAAAALFYSLLIPFFGVPRFASMRSAQLFTAVAVVLLISTASVLMDQTLKGRRKPQLSTGNQKVVPGNDELWRLLETGRWTEAEAGFRALLTQRAEDASVWNGLGWSLLNRGVAQEAEGAFHKALRLDPDLPGALNGMGHACLAQGKYGQAENLLLKAAPQASAAWAGLARLYLLQGRFSEADGFAQQWVSATNGDGFAWRVLRAARERHLDDDLRKMIEPPAARSKEVSANAELRALAWMDEGINDKGWQPDGTPLQLSTLGMPGWLQKPAVVDVQGTSEAKLKPRFLSLWISHPLADRQSRNDIALLDAAGALLPVPTGSRAASSVARENEAQGAGWMTSTVCAGTQDAVSSPMNIRLSYTAGPWEFVDYFPPDYKGMRSLAEKTQISGAGQDSENRTFIEINYGFTVEESPVQWDFVVFTKDGRRLERSGHSKRGSLGMGSERFLFSVPLAEVDSFEIRRRPVRTVVWPDVPMLTDGKVVLEVLGTGVVTHYGKALSKDKLRSLLESWSSTQPQPEVILKPSRYLSAKQLQEIMKQIAEANIWNLSIAPDNAETDAEQALLQLEINLLRLKEASVPDSPQVSTLEQMVRDHLERHPGLKGEEYQRKLRSAIADDPVLSKVQGKVPPRLEAVTWAGEKKENEGWLLDGTKIDLTRLKMPGGIPAPVADAALQGDKVTPSSTAITVWFTHPKLDSRSYIRLVPLNLVGGPLDSLLPIGTAKLSPAEEGGTSPGWAEVTQSLGSSPALGGAIGLRLLYSTGPWRQWGELMPGTTEPRFLSRGVTVMSPENDQKGRTLVRVTTVPADALAKDQWDFVAVTQDGKNIPAAVQHTEQHIDSVTADFIFEAPRASISKIVVSRRPILTEVWPNVPLVSKTDILIELLADGRVKMEERLWSMKELSERLKVLAGEAPSRNVLVKTPREGPHHLVFSLLRLCREAGLKQTRLEAMGAENPSSSQPETKPQP